MDDQSEVAAGPTCARKHAPTVEFPNFTKSAHYADDQVELTGRGEKQEGRSQPTDETHRAETERLRAITYLRLRQEKMADFAGVRYEALDSVYERYRAGALTDDDVTRLERLAAAVERRRPLLSPGSLQTAYAYHVLLRRSAEKIQVEEKREYLRSLDEYLRRNLRLTPAQIAGANRWLEHLGQVRLRRCAHWRCDALPTRESRS